MTNYPKVENKDLVGTYPALVKSGGGYVWDEVLEYRVWCYPAKGAPDIEDGDDYYYVFDCYEDTSAYSLNNIGAQSPIALVKQYEYISEPTPGEYIHVKEQRLTEWPVEFLNRPRRTEDTIPAFLSPTAPANKLDIIRGIA